jgi:V/A-type H+-transporting ATPase subunit A
VVGISSRACTDSFEEKKFRVKIFAERGQIFNEGEIFAEVQETEIITYRAMIPSGISGAVTRVASGDEFSDSDEIIKIGERSVSLSQSWAIRVPRPVKKKLAPEIPLITGQRVIDSLFPIAKGGTCAIPGGFGTGKTTTQHQLAKYCDADIIIYARDIIEPTRRSW